MSGTWLRGCSNYILTPSSPPVFSLSLSLYLSLSLSFNTTITSFSPSSYSPSASPQTRSRLRNATINVASWYQKWPFLESENRRPTVKGGCNKFLLPFIGVFTVPRTPTPTPLPSLFHRLISSINAPTKRAHSYVRIREKFQVALLQGSRYVFLTFNWSIYKSESIYRWIASYILCPIYGVFVLFILLIIQNCHLLSSGWQNSWKLSSK